MSKLAIFDMDGTVFESFLDWQRIREVLQIEKGGDILKTIYNGSQIDHGRLETLEAFERENTEKTVPIHGIKDFLGFLKTQKIPTALITNNNTDNTEFLLNKFGLQFDTVITRDMNLWKPEPDALLFAIKKYGSTPGETVSIGDSIYDIHASRRAGIPCIFIIDNLKIRKMLTDRKENGKDITFFRDYSHLHQLMFQKN